MFDYQSDEEEDEGKQDEATVAQEQVNQAKSYINLMDVRSIWFSSYHDDYRIADVEQDI